MVEKDANVQMEQCDLLKSLAGDANVACLPLAAVRKKPEGEEQH